MKKIILLISIFACSLTCFAQSSEWTKDDRNNIYDEYLNALTKYKNLTPEQKESIALCCLNKDTEQYTKKEYQAKINVEINRIQEATISVCAKNIGVNIESPQKQEIAKSKINEGNFNRKDLVGEWRDENSKIFFNEDATYLIKWDNGTSVAGKWWMNDVKDIIFEGHTKMKIISINENEFKYEQVTVTSRNWLGDPKTTKTFIYTATRVE